MKNRDVWLWGIFGCLCFGVGDWLLGFVDPTAITEQITVLKAGHGQDYDLHKITVTVLLGVIGVLFLLPCCTHWTCLLKEEKKQHALRFTVKFLPVGWVLIHVLVSVTIYAYAWCMQNGLREQALDLALDIWSMLHYARIVAYVLVAVPLLHLLFYTVQGATYLPRTAAFYQPILWMAAFYGLKWLVPPSAFVNGVDTFAMNGGLIVWFVYLILTEKQRQITNN